MKFNIASFGAGLLFGLGLLISGMANPEKVLGFLDIFGQWDPSLVFVMGGAILVGLFAFAIAKKRTMSFLGFDMRLPASDRLDKRLVLGSILFGAGWGLAGFCPGPGIVALGAGDKGALVFVVAMIAGMALFELAAKKRV